MVPSLDVFEVGPSMDEAITETGRRLGDGQDGTKPGPGAVELFGAVRLDGTVDEAVEVARRFAPDLVVHDTVDAMGPLIAAVLGVPLAEHRITGPMPEQLLQAIANRAEGEYTTRGVARPTPIAVVDPYPDALLPNTERDDSPGRLPLRPQPHSTTDSGRALPTPEDPVAAVTFGTSVQDPAAMGSLLQSIERAADESGCTPGSVARPPRGGRGDGHPSRTGVAAGLVRSTRGLGRAALERPRRAAFYGRSF